MLVALGAWIFAGEGLSLRAWIAISIISAGIMAIAVIRRNPLKSDRRTLAYTLANGVIIAAYSIVDGIGVRLSGDPLGYMAWLFFLEFPVVLVIVALRRSFVPAFIRSGMLLALAGGMLSVAAYGIVLFANTLAPLGAVSAVRESSVIIAALIGTFLLGETPRLPRLASAALVATGIIMLATVR
jgi:drug/metabolite transporter (DMT)-like permease